MDYDGQLIDIEDASGIHVFVFACCMRDVANEEDRDFYEKNYSLIRRGGIYGEMFNFSLDRARKYEGFKRFSIERLKKNLLFLEKRFLDS